MDKETLKQTIQQRLAQIHKKLDNATQLAKEVEEGFDEVLLQVKNFANAQKTYPINLPLAS